MYMYTYNRMCCVMCNVCRCLLRCILIHNLLQQNAEQLMGFANDLRIANCALVEAFERYKKHGSST